MSNDTVAVSSRPAAVPTTKLPAALRFPLLVTLSLSLSSLFYSLSSDYTAGDLATVSRSLNKWSEVGELIGWRTVELAIGWWGDYDSELPKPRKNTRRDVPNTKHVQATTSPR